MPNLEDLNGMTDDQLIEFISKQISFPVDMGEEVSNRELAKAILNSRSARIMQEQNKIMIRLTKIIGWLTAIMALLTAILLYKTLCL